jgi:hypothetical protein
MLEQNHWDNRTRLRRSRILNGQNLDNLPKKPKHIQKNKDTEAASALEQIHSDKHQINKSSIPRACRRNPILDGSKTRRQTRDEQDIKPPLEIRDSEEMKTNHHTQITD